MIFIFIKALITFRFVLLSFDKIPFLSMLLCKCLEAHRDSVLCGVNMLILNGGVCCGLVCSETHWGKDGLCEGSYKGCTAAIVSGFTLIRLQDGDGVLARRLFNTC